MEPWGEEQRATEEAVEAPSQAEVPSSGDTYTCAKKGWRVRVALILAAALGLMAGATFYNLKKAGAPIVARAIPQDKKGILGIFADNLLKGTSLFGVSADKSAKKPAANTTTKMSGTPLSLPLFFEANRGQTDPQVKFLARSGGYTLFVTPKETVFASAHTSAPQGGLSPRQDAPKSLGERAVLRMKFLESNPGPELTGIKELPGKVNYLIGNNPKDWHTGVPLYEEVRSREVYPGVDLVYHGDQQRLEYDFQVAPGADPGRIRFKIAGADKVAVDENGDLVLRTGKNEFRMRKPVIYQPEGERRRPVDGGFSVQAGKLVAFHVGAYDKKKTLVIDPTIVYATFLGAAGIEASGGMDLDIANPAAPKLFVSGSTSDATTFTETSSLLGTSGGAGDYAFVAKIDPTTTGAASLNFLTFIGGSLVFTGGTAPCQNFSTDLRVDASGGAGQVEAVVLGLTNCRDFPVTFGGPTTGTDDLFITRLTPSGAALDNSTLLGGNGSQGLTTGSGGSSLFVSQEGAVVLIGSTTSTDLATTANAYSVSFNNGTPGGFDDCYTAKLDRSFNILYLTYLNVGGNTTSSISASCGVGSMDAAGKIYFGGNIVSATAFNLINGGAGPNGFQTTFTGTPGTTPNGFVALLDPSQSGLNQMKYATYIGGGAGVVLRAGTVDLVHGMTVVVGDVISGGTTNIPLLNAFQSTNNAPAGATTGMITVIDGTKTGAASLVASSYFGGTTNVGFTSIRSLAIDAVPGNPPTQRIVVGGHTTATALPTMNPLQAALVGSQNAFVSMFSVPSPGSTFNMSLLFSTYLGGGVTIPGQAGDSVRNLITDPNHQVYALGRATSANFFGNTSPATTVNGFQATCASCGNGTPADDLAIFVLSPQSGTNVPDLTVSKSHSGTFSQGQSGAQFSITVTNSGTGSTVGTVSLADSLPSSLTATAMTGTGWTCSLGTSVCTRADALGAGMFYPVITLTVNVASNAPPSVTNTVVVSGGSETNTANDTASDVVSITSSVGACTNNYVGLTNGSWGTATNWSTGAIPVSTDVVCIPSSVTVLVNTSLAAANQTISGLNSSGTITFTAGPLTVTNNSVANIINLNGGTLAFNGQLTVSGAFTQTTGIFAGTGEVDLNGPFTWSGGTICSALTGASCVNGTVAKLNANGGISFPASTSIQLSSRMVNNNGTATWSGILGSLSMINSAVINNGPGSTWNYTNDSSLTFGGGGTVAFNNAGTFEKTNGTGTSVVNAPFHNTGTVMGNAATLSFSGGGNCGSSCSGSYISGSGGTIAFAGGLFAQSGPLSGAGTLNFTGATMDFGTGVVLISTTNVNISGGTLAGVAPGVIDFETRPNWSAGTICSLLSGISCAVGSNGTMNANAGINFPASANVLLSNRTLNNNGTATWSGSVGSMDAVNGAIINNPVNSVWNYASDSVLSFGGGAAVAFNNGGTFEKTAGTTSTTVSVGFNNTGMVFGNSGTITFTGGGNCGSTCGGSYTPTAPGSINFTGGIFRQSGSINGTGTVNFSGATMDFGTGITTISTTNVNFSAGNLAGAAPGVLNFSTPLNWSGGTMCSLLSGASCAVGTNATTNANAGINFLASANVLLSNRILNNNGTATWSGTAGSMDVVNSAIISNPPSSVWNFANDSIISFGGGTAPAFNNGGTFEKTGGTGSTTISLALNNNGTVMGNSGILSFSGGGNCGTSCTGTYSAGAGGTINFAGNVFAQSGPINGSGTVNFNGATMDFGTGTVTISAVTVNMTAGVLGGAAPGIVDFSSAPTWTGGTICSSLSGASCGTGTNATTNLNAGITFATSANVLLSNRTLNNNGTATWSGTAGSMDMVNGSIVNNGSIWNYTNDSILSYGGGPAVAFNNAGNFNKSGGTGTATVSTPFNNTGSVNGNSGIISFNSGGNCGSVCSGAFTAGTAGTLSFAGGTYPVSGTFSGAGTVNFNGGTMTLTGAYSVTGPTNVSNGNVNFNEATPVTIAGPLSFTGGTIAGSTTTLNLPGLFTWSGGTLGLSGTTNATGGISLPNTGAVVLSGGTLNTPAAVTFAAGGSGSSFLQSNGSIVNNTSTWNVQGDDFVSYNGGAVTTFNNNAGGIFEKTGGTTSSQINTVFNNNGTVTVGNTTGSATLLFNSGSCTIAAPCTGNGSWAALAGYTLAFNSGNYSLSGPFSGAGNVNFSGAIVNLTGTYGVTGPTNVASGTVNFNAGSPVTIAGPLTLTGGTIAGTASILNVPGTWTWSGGTLALPGTTNATGNIAFPNAGAMVLNLGTLNTSGAVTFVTGGSGSSFLLQNGSTANNTGTWNLQGDDFVTYNGGTATTFNNNTGGIFEKTGGSTGSQVTTAFKNAGTVLANAANLFFASTYTQTAGRTTLGGGSLQGTNVTPFQLQGGSLTGAGTLQGDVTNTGGSVAPGSATTAGAITLNGSSVGIYAQSGTGAYNVKIGGTAAGQFDTLTMSGAATLGGPLNVSLLNSFSPALGNSFTILTAASVTGTFSSTNLPALTTGLGWQVSYTGTTVVLSVVSVSTPIANLNPGSLTFPNTIVNTAAAVQKVQLQNTGTGPLIITSIQPTGPDAANYSYTADAVQPCPMSPASLGNGASCLLDIAFLPLTSGTHNNAQITVTDNSGSVVGSIQTVGLSGTGIVLNSIAVTPAPVTIPQGGTQQFTATGTYSDSSTQNLTSSVTWASATTTVATINTAGVATGVAPGTSNITAKQGSITSPAAVLTVTGATHFTVSSPVNAIAGTSFSVTIFAEDQFNSVVPGYTGTVHFTSTDPLAVLPANSTLTNGSGNFQVTLKTTGSQTYTATDTATSSITGTSNPVTVGTGAVTHFQVSLSGSPVVGSTDSFQVVALDQFGNAVTTYAGTVHFTSTDPAAVLPANTTLTGGVGTFSVTFKTVGSESVTATDTVTATITGTSNAIAVVSGAATHFQVAVPGIATVGVATSVTVVALDQFNNVASGYTGTVHFTSTDATAVLPANTTLTSGGGTFPVTFKTAGSQTITATDTVTATITGTSNTDLVSTGTVTHLLLAALPSVTAGTPFTLAVEALDQFNNIVTTYSGTVHFTSTDAAAVLPANSTLTSGIGSFQVTLKTTGSQTITGTDTVTSTLTGNTGAITVSSTTATHFIVSAPPSASAGTAVSLTVAALDQFSNIVTGYTGTVHFTSTDGAAVLPANSTLTSGVGVFQVTLKTAGSQTVTATDTVTATINGTSNTITVGPIVATHLLISAPATITAGTPFNIIVTALDQFSNIATGYTGTVHFTSTDGAAILPSNVTLINGTNTLSVTLKTVGPQTITGTDTVTASITGTSNTVTVTAATLQNIAVTPANPSIAKGLTQQFTATGMFSDGSLVDITTQVTWNSATPGVATINATGLATAVGTGTSNITASLLGVTSPVDVLTVTVAALQSLVVVPTAPIVAVGGTQQLNAEGVFSDGTTLDQTPNVTWQSSNTAQATITTGGLLSALQQGGLVTVTATSTSNSAIKGAASLTVAVPIGFALTGSMSAPRDFPAATVLTDGSVLITGGEDSSGLSALSTAEIYNEAAGTFSSTGNMTATRLGHTATLLPDGRVLIVGGKQSPIGRASLASAEIYNPASGTFTATGSMATGRIGHTATLLNNGTVLVAGGADSAGVAVSSAEVFDPKTGTFTPTGSMSIPRASHTATLLGDGTVLIAGAGTAEVYSTAAGTFTAVSSMAVARNGHTATLLDDGTVLMSGGFDGNVNSLNSAELYNPVTKTFVLTGSMAFSRDAHTATLLNNGIVLIVGGNIATQSSLDLSVLPTAEVYDPVAKTFSGTGSLNFARDAQAAVRLTDGKVLATGGDNIDCNIVIPGAPSGNGAIEWCVGAPHASAELYTPSTFTQPGLASITVTPANPSIILGTFQKFTATGTFTGGGQQTLASITWRSSNPTGLSITNDDVSDLGRAFGLAPGSVTITACEGAVCGSTGATVPATLQSITVAPTSASVAAGLTQPFTATGHFSDGTSGPVSVNWSSSNTAIATINSSGVATGVAPGGPITITATSGNIFGTTQLTVTPLVTFPLNVALIGTGTGSVTDNLGSINCVNTAGVISGTCSANYPSGTIVSLTATPTQPSTFGGYLGACTGTGACSITMNSVQSVTASFVPPPQAVPVSFTPGTNVSAQAVYDCPSNPNPTPANPCLDPNAHSAAFTIGQVLTPFTLTVVSTEVPPTNGDGICESGRTPGQDLDCRFTSFFTFQTRANGDAVVPLCDPYANGNCVVYSVFFQNAGQEPDPSMYVGPVNWNITFNNGTFVPPAPWTGSTPRLYYDPSGFVVPNSPYGTDCTTPMLIGNPGTPTSPAIFCQFVFDITTIFDASKKVDPLIGGKTKVFSDAIVAFPPSFAPVVTVTTTPDAPTVTAGSPIGFTIIVSNSAAAVANNVSLNTPLPGGTNVNWAISPAFAGPGTCSITGAQGSQVLNCAFGTLAQSASATLHILSTSSAAGTAISPSTVTVDTQQLFSIGSIVVQPVPVTFSGLSTSQSITVGTSSVTLAGVVGNGTQFAPSGEAVSITINGNTQTATIGSNGAFSLQFPTAALAASATPYAITYSYAGDSLLSSASNNSTTLTVTSLVVTFPLNVTLIGTGTGSVTDNLGSINCVNTAGVTSGTCSANYPVGTIVSLTASATQPSTFGGWLQACSGTTGCSVTMNSAQSVTASFVPPPQAVPLPFTPGTNVTAQAPFDCPSNPNPTPGNPCLDPNAHAAAFTIGQVLTPFTLTVVATEVPPTNGDGICENGRTPGQDLDCRFGTFFTFQTKANGDRVVPLCDPYANGNCVVYSVFFQNPGQEPDPSMYVGPVNWNITYNNGTFVPPAPWTGSTPRLYYDPSGFVVPNSPYGTDCTTPMLIGNPGVPTNPVIFCQFVFDITTIFDASKKVDPLIGGKTKVFSDAIVAFPPVFAPVVTVTTTPDAATVTAGSPIGFTITVSNSALAVANNVSLNTPLPGGANVNWTISPAFAGPGTCSITGAQGSQVLNCAFGTLNQSASVSLHILSASSAAGTAISPSTVNVGNQQLLSIGSIVVQPIPVTFSGLTASQTIPAGTSSVTLGGVIGNGTQFAPSGETVSITINGSTQSATVGSNGAFSLQFPTANIPASTTPYPITYSYAGDSLLSTATNSSMTLTAGGGGEPRVSVKEVGSGTSHDSFFVDVQFTNTGNGVARNLKFNSVTFKTLLGRGNVTLNTARSPKLPDNLESFDVGASVTVRLYLNAPPGVPRFLMTETGTVGDVTGKTFSYSAAETVSATGRDREPGRGDDHLQ